MDIDKTFDERSTKGDRVSDEEKGLPDVFVRAVMSHHYGARTKVNAELELSEKV